MNIQYELKEVFNEKVFGYYNEGKYTDAIRYSVMIITELIREKSGLLLDGHDLVNNAFSLKNPLIRINNLQTESERNIQQGTMDILKGIYTAIRNPRSHDLDSDTKEDAEAIMIFTDYLIGLIDKSKGKFDLLVFMDLLIDPMFHNSEDYILELLYMVPKSKKIIVAKEMLNEINRENYKNYSMVFSYLMDHLNSNEREVLYEIINEKLMRYTEFDELQPLLKMFPGKYFNKLSKLVRIRIENHLFNDFNNGTFNKERQEIGEYGALATWISFDYFKYFNRKKWTDSMVKKLMANDENHSYYIKRWFWEKIILLNYHEVEDSLNRFITKSLKDKVDIVLEHFSLIVIPNNEHPWNNIFKEQIKLSIEDIQSFFPF